MYVLLLFFKYLVTDKNYFIMKKSFLLTIMCATIIFAAHTAFAEGVTDQPKTVAAKAVHRTTAEKKSAHSGNQANFSLKKRNQLAHIDHLLIKLQSKKPGAHVTAQPSGKKLTSKKVLQVADTSLLVQKITDLKAKISADTTITELKADQVALAALLAPAHK